MNIFGRSQPARDDDGPPSAAHVPVDETGEYDWLTELTAVWNQHRSLTTEAEMLRARLEFVEQQLGLRRHAIDLAQQLHDALLKVRDDTTDLLAAPPPPTPLQREHRPAPTPAPAPLREPDVLVSPLHPVVERHAHPAPDRAPTSAPRRTRGTRRRAADNTLVMHRALLVGKVMASVAAAVVVVGLLLVTVGPRFLPYQALVVRSGSMSPTIPTGSIVFYKKAGADQIKKGDVIVFSRPDDPTERVTHRVFAVKSANGGRYFVTKGDANGSPDDWRVPAQGSGWVAVTHVPFLGYVLGYLQTGTAKLLLVVVPALGLGAITVAELWRKEPEAAA